MTITQLRIMDFRNFPAIEISPSPQGLNIIYGENGSGKTSLLEAIYYLSQGKSFRSSIATALIRQDSAKFSLFAQLLADSERQVALGVERHLSGSSRLRLENKEAATVAEMAAYLPVRIINSYSYQLLESGPAFRRKYLDWGLFYQDAQFLACWRAYERALKQRNVLLRDKRSKQEIEVWSNELAKHGEALTQRRIAYVENLVPQILSVTQELLPLSDLKIIYQPGWNSLQTLAQALTTHFAEEWRLGSSQFGPHRADLDILTNGMSIKHFLSRGQQKLLICAMILAQGMLLAKETHKRLIYLVDDLPAELDELSRKKILSLLSKQQAQVFITAIESKAIFDLINHDMMAAVKVFHVKHGSITTIN